MNAAITGQVLPDSVILWLMVILAGVAVWAHAAPRPLRAIISDAARVLCEAAQRIRAFGVKP